MLMPCFAALYDELGHRADRHRLLVLRLVGLPCRAGILVHLRDRLDRRGAADQRVARGDGRRVGALRGLHQDPDRRGGHRAGLRVRQVLGRDPAAGAVAMQTDPYTVAPLWPDSVSMAGLQARFGLDSGKWTAEQMAQVALDSFAAAGRTDREKPAKSIDELLDRPFFADPLRRHDIAPITDGASAIVLAVGDRARELREEPRLDHRYRAPHRDPGARRPGPHHLAVDGGVSQGRDRRRHRLDRSRRDLRAVHPSAADPDRGHRAAGVDEGQPVGRRAGGQPDVLRRAWSASALRHNTSSTAPQVGCSRTRPAGLRCNRIWSPSGREELMAGQLAAVLGTGQTKYVAKRQDVSMNGLVREAIDKALADSGSTMHDIDAVVVGKAPDFFEGVMMPELFMADAIGATGKPLIRVHTAGSVGGVDRRGGDQPGAIGQVPARAGDGVGEAVRVECHVGVEHSGAVHQAGRCRCGRLLRSARARLHPPIGRADTYRRHGRGQGPAATAPRTRWRICISPTSRWRR